MTTTLLRTQDYGTHHSNNSAPVSFPADPQSDLRIAIVHDQLYTVGGAEKVLQQICRMYPKADVFSLFNLMNPSDLKKVMGDRTPNVTFLQKMPCLSRLRKLYFFLMPIAIEQLDLSEYDLIISSSYLVAKGVIAAPDQTHVCYLHSPMRYAWDQQSLYLSRIPSRLGFRRAAARLLLHYMRGWDVRSSNGVDMFLANSSYVARRALKAYRRQINVLYPPVDIGTWSARDQRRDGTKFVTMSRLVEGKRVELLLEAFRLLPDCRLVVIGEGAERAALEAAAPPNVQFLGWLADEDALREITSSSAFVYAAEEDFGISTVEAQASGTPVVAYRAGGSAEIVVDFHEKPDGPTGVLFARQTPEDVAGAVRLLQRNRSAFDEATCRANAERFSIERFERGLSRAIQSSIGARSSLAPASRTAVAVGLV